MAEKSELLKASGLWQSSDKEGNMILSGSLGGVRVLIFKNRFKEEDGENAPDFQMYFTKNEKREG